MAVNYSILADVELNTSTVQKQLNNLKVNFGIGNAKKELDNLNTSMSATSLTFQAANEIFSTATDIISSMVEQIFELDAALTEFKKVSDLSGSALDNYVAKLSEMGTVVARTGKPKRQAPDNGIVNQYQEPLEIQYNLIAHSTTMVA